MSANDWVLASHCVIRDIWKLPLPALCEILSNPNHQLRQVVSLSVVGIKDIERDIRRFIEAACTKHIQAIDSTNFATDSAKLQAAQQVHNIFVTACPSLTEHQTIFAPKSVGWLQSSNLQDVLPTIMSFLSFQRYVVASRTCRRWFSASRRCGAQRAVDLNYSRVAWLIQHPFILRDAERIVLPNGCVDENIVNILLKHNRQENLDVCLSSYEKHLNFFLALSPRIRRLTLERSYNHLTEHTFRRAVNAANLPCLEALDCGYFEDGFFDLGLKHLRTSLRRDDSNPSRFLEKLDGSVLAKTLVHLQLSDVFVDSFADVSKLLLSLHNCRKVELKVGLIYRDNNATQSNEDADMDMSHKYVTCVEELVLIHTPVCALLPHLPVMVNVRRIDAMECRILIADMLKWDAALLERVFPKLECLGLGFSFGGDDVDENNSVLRGAFLALSHPMLKHLKIDISEVVSSAEKTAMASQFPQFVALLLSSLADLLHTRSLESLRFNLAINTIRFKYKKKRMYVGRIVEGLRDVFGAFSDSMRSFACDIGPIFVEAINYFSSELEDSRVFYDPVSATCLQSLHDAVRTFCSNEERALAIKLNFPTHVRLQRPERAKNVTYRYWNGDYRTPHSAVTAGPFFNPLLNRGDGVPFKWKCGRSGDELVCRFQSKKLREFA